MSFVRFRHFLIIFAAALSTHAAFANTLPAPKNVVDANSNAYAPPANQIPQLIAERSYHRYKVYLDGGLYFQSLENNNAVTFLGDSTTFTYNTNTQTNTGGIFGAGFGITNYICNYCSATLAASILGATSNTVSGTGSGLGNFNYQFTTQSLAMLFETHFVYTQYSWQPLFVAGIGFSRNNLTSYSDNSGDPDQQFSNNAQISFAYELGLGVQKKLYFNNQSHTAYDLGLEYRYINFGSGELGYAADQTTTDNYLQVHSMSMNTLLLALTIAFGQ